jgi:hypothetical protein
MSEQSIGELWLLTLAELAAPEAGPALLVRAWHRFPEAFGLEGFPDRHPDARHLAELKGIRPEWLRREQDGYSLTAEGRAAAAAMKDGRPLPRPMHLTAEEMLAELTRHARPVHRWQEYADLVSDGGISSADRFGFTVELGDGQRSVEFPSRMTGGKAITEAPELYRFLAPRLEDRDRGTLAKGVVENLVGGCHWSDLEGGWRILGQRHGGPEEYEEDWLPAVVEERGFGALADELRAAIEQTRDERQRAAGQEHEPKAGGGELPAEDQDPDSRYVFQQTHRTEYTVRYTTAGGEVEECREVPARVEIKLWHRVLRDAPQPVPWEASVELDQSAEERRRRHARRVGLDDDQAELLDPLRADRAFRRDLPLDPEAQRDYRRWLALEEERTEAIAASNDEETRRLEEEAEEVKRGLIDSYIKRQRRGKPGDERLRATARKYLSRGLALLRERGLHQLADHLSGYIGYTSEGIFYHGPLSWRC